MMRADILSTKYASHQREVWTTMGNEPMPPAGFQRVQTDRSVILRLRPAWRSYWRALLGMVLTFLLWRAQRELFDAFASLFGVARDLPVAGLLLGWAPFVGYMAFDRLIHVFELENERLLRARVGLIARKTDEFVLSERLQIQVNQTAMGRLLGFGTLAFWSGEVAGRLEWTNISSPEAVRRYLNALRDASTQPTAQSHATASAPSIQPQSVSAPSRAGHVQGEVPTGTRFGNRVAVLPGLSYAFSHSGALGKSSAARPYTWIERGTPIGGYSIQTPRIDVPILGALVAPEVQHVMIRSPVSGLILHSDYSYCGDVGEFIGPCDANWRPPAGTFAVLLAQSEPAPDSGAQMFGDACRLAAEHARLFHRNSRQWSKAGIPPQEFTDILRRQETLSCRLVDATQHYGDYLEEAARKLPALAPLLAHLQPVSRSGATSA